MGRRAWRPWPRTLPAASAIAVLVTLLALIVDPSRAAFAYLAAWAFWLGVGVGVLMLLLIQNAIGSLWFVPLRRLAETMALALLPLALLFVPVLLLRAELFPWLHPQAFPAPVAELLRAKRAWLSPPAFVLRSLLYLLSWCGVATLLWRRSLEQEREPRADAAGEAQRRISVVVLPAAALAVSFSGVDWLMSLEPAWSSSMFGVYWFSAAMVSGLSALVIGACFGLRREGGLAPSHFHALGKLLLTFLMFEGYVAFCQYMLVWIADLPSEASWFLVRTRGGWGWLASALVIGGFALPFLALLSRPLKRRASALAATAAWLLLFHALEIYWIVVPACAGGDCSLHWSDPFAFVAVGSICILFCVVAWRRHAALPVGDARLPRALRYSVS